VSQPTIPDRRARRRERTRAAILDAAERLFLRQGFQATTVERLAEEADVAIGSLYAHFGGKEGVYAALIDRALELDARYSDAGWASGTDPLGRLVGLAEGYLRFAREHPGHFRLFRFPPDGVPGHGPAAAAAARVAVRVESEIVRMAGALREAIATGVVRPLDPERAAVVLWTAWDGVIAAQVLPGGMGLSDEEFDAVLELAREILTRGLLDTGEAQS
jgi:AcrR family transcriptional regulator